MILQAQEVWFAYEKAKPVLRGIDGELDEGELLFLLGANGSGKTTLLRCLAGILSPDQGRVYLEGEALHDVPPRRRAQKLALVPQTHAPVFSYTTHQLVLMGRAPHIGALAGPARRDRQVARWALEAVGLTALADRPFTALSGGEQRLALIARGLAQGAKVLLMDEPDANLDPAHQHSVLGLASHLARQGLAVAVTSHNPNNALTYGNCAALLTQGTLVSGSPRAILTEGALQRAYGVPFRSFSDDDGSLAVIPTTPAHP